MGFSEGVLNEPVNPDYYYPTNIIVYEVERLIPGEKLEPPRVEGEWRKQVVDFGETYTDDITQATRVRDTIREAGYKSRVIQVETIRSQVS